MRLEGLADLKADHVYLLTGFRSVRLVKALFDWVNAHADGAADELMLYRGPAESKQQNKTKSSPRRKQSRAMDGLNQLFLTLFLLRTGVHLNVAAILFDISAGSVTAYFVTWLFCLTQFCRLAMPFPSQKLNRDTIPQDWVDLGYNRTRIIVDTTNVDLPVPSDTDVNSATFQRYYGGSVAKILVGINPAGAVTFASLPYPGKISDADLFKRTILMLELLDEEDDVLVDRGFTVHSDCAVNGIGCQMPPMKNRRLIQFSRDQGVLGSKSANRRIHIERAMKRCKAFGYLHRVVPLDQLDILSHIVYVIAFLSNFQCPLTQAEEDEDFVQVWSGDEDNNDNANNNTTTNDNNNNNCNNNNTNNNNSNVNTNPSVYQPRWALSDIEWQNPFISPSLPVESAAVSSTSLSSPVKLQVSPGNANLPVLLL